MMVWFWAWTTLREERAMWRREVAMKRAREEEERDAEGRTG